MKKLLDLFCGAGGCSEGYRRAGFTVYGIDNRPQPHYPFPFLQMDALEAMDILLKGGSLTFSNGETLSLNDFDAFHTSPPCQRYSTMTKYHGLAVVESHPNLLMPTRERLILTKKPYVIENVKGSPMLNWTMLCGSMFGLSVMEYYCSCGGIPFEYELGKYGCPNCCGENIAKLKIKYQLRRHRWFETSWEFVFPPSSCCHQGQPLAVYGHSGGTSKRDRIKFPGIEAWKSGMGIDWMNGDELSEANPPVYTEYIGKYLLQAVQEVSHAREGN